MNSQRQATIPRCMIPARPVRRLAANALYDLRNTVAPLLGELIAGILLVGGAALLPVLLLMFA